MLASDQVSGNATIRASVGDSEIVITTTDRLAGAIHSLTWNGKEFIDSHDHVFVVEQNRDAQMRTLLVNELEFDPERLIKILHYDGTPITARFITKAITNSVHALAVTPRRERNAS